MSPATGPECGKMKATILLAMILSSAVVASHAADGESSSAVPQASPEPATKVEGPQAPAGTPESVSRPGEKADFCLFAGEPPAELKYTTLRALKVGKGSYGGVTDILPKMVEEARQMGADAIIHYAGSQRFGFWPWRVVRPVVRGTAIKWNGPQPDCAAVGGTPLGTVLATNKAPEN